MRVLQVISPTGFYGAERWILALARYLGELDIGCDLAVTSESPKKQFELLKRFPVDNGRIHRVELANRFDLRSVGILRSIIDERGIDVVHSHGYKSDFLGLLAARRAHVPCISTPHGYGHGRDLKLRFLIRTGGRGLRWFDKVVPLSDQLASETLALGVPREKIVMIDNGVDLREMDNAVEGYRVDPSVPGLRMGYVGQLIPRKRVQDVVSVFDDLWQRDHRRTLDIAGDGSERASLEALAGSLRSAAAIRFHGFVERRLELMSKLDLFVMTSESEGIPRCLMEAQGLGLPVVAYDIPGVDALVIDEKTGLLAPFGDRRALADRCERMLSDRGTAARIANEGRDHVRACFSAERMAERYAKLYQIL